jgi:tetratricopeptide (TPR) repeat protein
VFAESEKVSLTCLTRLAQRQGTARQWIAAALRERLETLIEPALNVAVETGDPIGQVLDEIFQGIEDRKLLSRVMRWFEARPLGDPVPLMELALTVNRRLLDRRLERSGPASDQEALLDLWLSRNLAQRLRNVGHFHKALNVGRQALARARELAAGNPMLFESTLGQCLRSLATTLAVAGRHEEAAQLASEAVELFSRLQQENRHDPYDLARSLEIQSMELGALGQSSAGLEAISQAVEIYGQLQRDNPQKFRVSLGSSLYLLSSRLSELGRWREAHEAARQASDVARDVAEAEPAAYLPRFAEFLNNLGKQLYLVGEVEASVQVIRDATDILRKLHGARPGVFQHRLAVKLSNQAALLAEIDQARTALPLAEEATAIYRELAESDPEAYLPELILCLQSLTMRLDTMGRPEEALKVSEEALTLRGRVGFQATNAHSRRAFADSLEFHGLQLQGAGRTQEALPLLEEAIGLRRNLAAELPSAFEPVLAQGLLNLANARLSLRHVREAASAIDEAVKICGDTVQEGGIVSKVTLTQILSTRAVLLQELGETPEALWTQRRLHRMLEVLVKSQPLLYRKQLALNLENLGISQGYLGHPKAAVRHLRKALSIWRALLDETPEAHRADLSRVLHNLSYHRGLAGQKRAAVAEGEEAVRWLRQLSLNSPDVYEPKLVESLHNLANQYFLAARWRESLRSSREAMVLIRRLAKKQPELYTQAAARGALYLKRRISMVRDATRAAVDTSS